MGKKRKRINWRYYNNVKTYINKFRKLDKLRIKTIEEYKKELEEMNKNKRGRRYTYTNSIILYLLLLMILLKFSLREVVAYVIYYKLLKKTPNYRTVSDRAKKIYIDPYKEILKKISNVSKIVAISIDATGFSKVNINPWFEEKHKTKGKREWVKVEMIVDVKTGEILYHNIYHSGNKVNEGEHRRFKRTIERIIRRGYNGALGVSLFKERNTLIVTNGSSEYFALV